MLILLLAALAAAYGFYSYLLSPLFFSPLSRIPAPHWSCAISSFWILRARKQFKENKTLSDAHSRHGPIVRVGPNTLSVDSVDAIRTIYQGGFDKWSWYSVFDFYGVPCVFSSLGSHEHGRRKRIVSRVYSKSYIQSSPAVRAQGRAILLGRLLPLLRREAARSEGIEMQSIILSTTMDLICAFNFGVQAGTNFLEDHESGRHWFDLYGYRFLHFFWPQEFPAFTSLCSKLGFRLYPSSVDEAHQEIEDWNKRMCDEARDVLAREKSDLPPQDEPIVLRALYEGMEKAQELKGDKAVPSKTTSTQHRHLEVASETLDHVLAGFDTSGVALGFLIWQLSQDPDLQDKLRAELLTVKAPSLDVLPESRDLDNLPLLHAVIMETLRRHPPIPGSQPRITPYPSSKIAGYQVPGGVRISAMAGPLHLDETVYPDPLRWDHTRWLPGVKSGGEMKQMNRNFWAFGSGGRMCLGSNFAWNSLNQVTYLIYSNFRTSLVGHSSMEQMDAFVGRPKGEKLNVKLTPIGS
ncbi:cytochrome P450 monooxygenase [Ophiocordyceps camponoti-floridani]|uniref:Cytochrome P450 monooxygenase n=1 Tax=Ophiocordyceps camponoti-floridani TaxID=2030778 RepID=A0A8H4VAD7_9HYPO|nr:cytochrome P450 monooxygenase [Ophiocordyceps camponoti-floridani]